LAFASRISGSARTLAVASITRALSGAITSSATTRSAANIALALTARTAGGATTMANAIRSLALSVRTAGRSAAQGALEAEGIAAITAQITAGARVIGSLVVAKALTASAAGQSAIRASQNVVRALSSASVGRGSVRGAANMALALSAKVQAGARAAASQAVSRALSSVVRAGASVRANLPPLFEEVVGIVRGFIQASMRVARMSLSMKQRVITASGQISRPIVVSANNMIAKNVTLKGYVIGDDTEIAFQLTDWPAGVLLSKAYFTMKKSLKDSDASAIIQREITPTLTAEGKITANGASGTAEGYFLIRHQDTEWANVKAGLDYQFDIQPITDQATVQTPVIGTISFVKGATGAIT
jgi:hypothetical protein